LPDSATSRPLGFLFDAAHGMTSTVPGEYFRMHAQKEALYKATNNHRSRHPNIHIERERERHDHQKKQKPYAVLLPFLVGTCRRGKGDYSDWDSGVCSLGTALAAGWTVSWTVATNMRKRAARAVRALFMGRQCLLGRDGRNRSRRTGNSAKLISRLTTNALF